MSKFDKPTRSAAAVVMGALLLAPFVATAGLVEDNAAAAAKPERGYMLRCWQGGG